MNIFSLTPALKEDALSSIQSEPDFTEKLNEEIVKHIGESRPLERLSKSERQKLKRKN